MSRFLAVTTVKNEGPYVLEWVAHHRLCGFDRIVVFQNDSDDTTVQSLRVLARLGVIEFFDNPNDEGKFQAQAYRRASRLEAFASSDWCMALDFDEYLGVRVGAGGLEDLVTSCPTADAIMVNWRNFGSGGQLDLDQGLLTERFTMTEDPSRMLGEQKHTAFKTLFRTSSFARPGIHFPRVPTVERPVLVNGSGIMDGAFPRQAWRSADPGGYALAQINHYIIRDVMSFILKSARGSANAPHRDLGAKYWSTYEINEAEDRLLADRSAAIWTEMKRLDDLSDGLLMRLRLRAFRQWRTKFRNLVAKPEFAELRQQIGPTPLAA